MQYRYDIQGLRALAVLLVFFFHLSPATLSGGFVGVDIFFVISGYLISGIILHKKEQNKFHFLDFYISRFARILPAYSLFLVITFSVAIFLYLPSDIINIRNNVFWSALFFSNQYLAQQNNYFGMSSLENPFLHTWSLAIEMQFYFLLPFHCSCFSLSGSISVGVLSLLSLFFWHILLRIALFSIIKVRCTFLYLHGFPSF